MRSSKSSSTRSILESLVHPLLPGTCRLASSCTQACPRRAVGHPWPELVLAQCIDLSYSININHIRRAPSKAVHVIDLGIGWPTKYRAFIRAFFGGCIFFFNWAWSDRHQRLCIRNIPSTIPHFHKSMLYVAHPSHDRTSWRIISPAMAGARAHLVQSAGSVNGLTVVRAFSSHFLDLAASSFLPSTWTGTTFLINCERVSTFTTHATPKVVVLMASLYFTAILRIAPPRPYGTIISR